MQPLGGPYYAVTVVDAGGGFGAWTTPGNAAGAPNAAYASGNISSGGAQTNNLKATGFGFTLPPTAVIDGILAEFDRYGSNAETLSIQLMKAGVAAGTAKTGVDIWPVTTPSWFGYGSVTDLWGTAWAASDINNANFGVLLSAVNTHGGGTAFVDSIRITVYWHWPAADVLKRHIYKVFNNLGVYIGVLPQPKNDFQYGQDINTAGTSITIEVPVSADTAILPVGGLTDESDDVLTDENDNPLTDDIQQPIVGLGSQSGNALIKDGNLIEVWEVSYYHPDGKIRFRGKMERWEASFGGSGGGSGGATTSDASGDSTTITCYSDGQDLDDYPVLEGQTIDQSQFQFNSSFLLNNTVATPQIGQEIFPAAGVTGIQRITLRLAAVTNNNPTVTVSIYASRPGGILNLSNFLSSNPPDAVASQVIGSTSQNNYDFAFRYTFPPNAPGGYYIIRVDCSDAAGVNISYFNTTVYNGVDIITASTPSGSITGDLYFITYATNNTTNPSFPAEDPSNMLLDIMYNYGGRINASGLTVQPTGLSLTYNFNTSTIFEAVQALLTLAPNGFYWYIDVATDTLYFKQANAQADIILTKGKHLDQVTIIASIENTKNSALFSGGVPTGGTTNIYTQYSDTTSITRYGQKLDRLSDNHVTDIPTGRQVAQADVLTYRNESFHTTVTVLDRTMDLTLLQPGLTVGFNGFGTFIDSLVLQIARLDVSPEEVTLTLGSIPQRMHGTIEETVRSLLALQTIANPATPS